MGEIYRDQLSPTLHWGSWVHFRGEMVSGSVPRWRATNASSQSLLGTCWHLPSAKSLLALVHAADLQTWAAQKGEEMLVGSRQGKYIHASWEGLCPVSASQAFHMWSTTVCCHTSLAKVVGKKKVNKPPLIYCKYSCTLDQALTSLIDRLCDPFNLHTAATSVE